MNQLDLQNDQCNGDFESRRQ